MAEDQTAKITYLRGNAYIGTTAEGPWEDVKVGISLATGRFIRTSQDSYLEFILPNGSKIRLAPETLFEIEASQFNPKQPHRFSAKLFLGKMWAKVTWATRLSKNSFKAKTTTAVLGVRGTVFDLRTFADRSTDIWVYDGVVAVEPPLVKEDAEHKEMEWPRQVSESKWEEIILGKLQKLHIGPDGKPGKPLSFDPYKEKDYWTTWNLERDKVAN